MIVGVLCLLAMPARAEPALPDPLRVDAVMTLARQRRSEITAAKARARAAAQRPAIAAALEEPIIAVSVDHLPFDMMGVDGSVTVEQRFPLSRVRGHRERSARAESSRELANVARVGLDIELAAATSFWMLAQVRASAAVIERQHGLAEQLVAAATARYSSNTGTQSDVLRAKIEVARLDGERRALAAEARGAEVMLNTSLARDPGASIPALVMTVSDSVPVSSSARAVRQRPELRAGRAEIQGAEAELRVMRSMYSPMAMVRTGPAFTMEAGPGWMLMIGVSIPLWRGKLRAGVAEANAMVDMATADLDAMTRMVDGEARGARETVIAARERYVTLRDAVVPLANAAIAPTLAAYSTGQVPLISVVEAAQTLWSAELELTISRAQLGIAWARLGRASGEETRP